MHFKVWIGLTGILLVVFLFLVYFFWFYVDDPEAYHHQIKLMLLHAFGIVVDQSN